MKSATFAGSLRYASGEELLLLTIFGTPATKRKIDRELDRRAWMRRFTLQLPRVTRRAA